MTPHATAEPADPTPDQQFPGGGNTRPYRWAFAVWLALFLGLVAVGFLNFLGTKFHRAF